MESYKGGLKGFWRRRGYHRVDGGTGGRRRRRQRLNRAELGAERCRGGAQRTFWRIKVAPRLALLRATASPCRVLRRLRDAYVRMMLAFSGAVSLGGYGYGVNGGVAGFARPPLKEYDERVLVDVYKSLIAASTVGGASIALLH